jgi:predicted nucleic acid-binding protein
VIVVSDTSPLNYLVLIGAIDVLQKLFKQVYAPHAVLRELMDSKAPHAVVQWAKHPPAWLMVLDPSVRLASTARLDLGEAHAISLAKEMGIKDILIDERRGSKVARDAGLFPLPTLAVLERAAERGLLDLPQVINNLRQTTIRVPRNVLEAALGRDAARKDRSRGGEQQI